jgi:NhaP-type Na+/H+ or K+/H+ antiporter
VLLGAIVAPTDPVLATDVQIRHPGDRDQPALHLTCEAGMNDGSAFPFVMLGLGLLGLHDLGDFGLRWVLVRCAVGDRCRDRHRRCPRFRSGPARLDLRSRRFDHKLMDDFLGLGLIGVVYGLSELVNAWGFLAVFFAAVSLRQTEVRLAVPGPPTWKKGLPSTTRSPRQVAAIPCRPSAKAR